MTVVAAATAVAGYIGRGRRPSLDLLVPVVEEAEGPIAYWRPAATLRVQRLGPTVDRAASAEMVAKVSTG